MHLTKPFFLHAHKSAQKLVFRVDRCVFAGLHEGLRSLITGGVPPGFLIIDDGWQCTDVDEPLRHAVMQTMMKQLNMPEAEETSDEFIEAELEMLSMGAKGIPQGTALGKHLLGRCCTDLIG